MSAEDRSCSAAVLSPRAAAVAVTGHRPRKRPKRTSRRYDDAQIRRSDSAGLRRIYRERASHRWRSSVDRWRRLHSVLWARRSPQRLRLRGNQGLLHRGRLPVIDNRSVLFEDVVRLAVHEPMVAVGEKASPPPHHALSYAPLNVIAEAYRAAGAEVFNIPGPAELGAAEE
jgi:hypothetical protein